MQQPALSWSPVRPVGRDVPSDFLSDAPLIICLIIQTIRRDPSRSVWIDEASNVSRLDSSGAVQVDAEHQAYGSGGWDWLTRVESSEQLDSTEQPQAVTRQTTPKTLYS